MTKQEAAPASAPYRHLALTKGELAPTALSAGAAGPGAEGVYPARYLVLPGTGLIGSDPGIKAVGLSSAGMKAVDMSSAGMKVVDISRLPSV